MASAIDPETLVINGGSAAAGSGDYELVDVGSYVITITDIGIFHGTKFGTTEPEDKLKFVYTIDNDTRNTVPGWEGATVEHIVPIPKNMANERAKVGIIWQAATGEAPQEGKDYPIKRGLLGKKMMVSVVHSKPNSNGFVWPRVGDVMPLPVAQASRRRTAAAPVVEDDDDLKDA